MRYLFALLLTVFLITVLWLLVPVGLMAAQDDSGLKMFELKASDMLGMVYDPLVKHNSNCMSDMQNMIKTENGFANLSINVATTTTAGDNLTIGNIVALPSSTTANNFVYYSTWNQKTGGYAIFNKSYAVQETSSGATIEASIINKGFRFFYSGAINTFLSTDVGFYYKTDAATYWTKKTLPGAANAFSTCDVYKNRLFGYDSTENYIYYSAATDLLDFTVSADSGGVILMPSVEKILHIQSLRGGLAIFCLDGIYMLSGDEPLNFSIEKISNVRMSSVAGSYYTCKHFNSDGNFYFNAIALSGAAGSNYAIYVMDQSGNIQKISDCVNAGTRGMTVLYDRFVIVCYNTASGLSHCYDLKFKCWYPLFGIEAVYDVFYLVKNPISTIYAKKIEIGNFYSNDLFVDLNDTSTGLLYLQSQWMNLNSNANVNIIRRIEVDCVLNKGSATSTGEITIYTENQTNTFTLDASDVTSINSSYSDEPMTTFFLNTNSIRLTNRFKFKLQAYRRLMWQSIRIYYEPKGNYKRKEIY